MRNIVAKRLRKQAREISNATEYHTYWWSDLIGKVRKGKTVNDMRVTVTCTGYRRVYQDLKQRYYQGGKP